MTAKGQNFEMYQGNTYQLVIPVTNPDGSAFDLSGYSVIWVMYHPQTLAVMLQKTLASGASVPTPSNGTILIDIDPADTENMTPRVYNHECQISNGVDNIHTVSVGTATLVFSKA